MRTSEDGIKFIAREEGMRLTAYQDIAGNLTIGFGRLIQEDDEIALTITEKEAWSFLHEDIGEVDGQLSRCVEVDLTQYQWDACASFVFNLGYSRFAGSKTRKRSTLLTMINAGDFAGAAGQFGRWVYAGDMNHDGVVNYEDRVTGLVNRRAREAKLFSTGDYSVPTPG